MEKLLEAKAAINALGTNNAHEANKWLVEFELLPEAWNIAQLLLLEPSGNNYRFYGANIFYNKIRREFYQLKDSANSLKNALVNHIITLSQENPLDITVIRRICLALAVLALQLNQRGVVNEILGYMNPIIETKPQILLELLTVLPEECFNRHIDVDNSIREEFSQQLSESSPQVLEFLTTFISNDQKNTQLQIQLLRCFSRWIENTKVSQTLLASHPLLQFTLSSLQNQLLFEEATDVIISLFRQYSGQHCLDEDMVLPSVLVPVVVSLSSLWDNNLVLRNEHDEEVCRGISRLFTEMVESYLFIITQNFDIGQQGIMEQMLLCAAYPWNNEISRIPLKGFYELSAFIKNSGIERVELINKYANYYCRLLEILIQQLKLSTEALFSDDKLNGEDQYNRDEIIESVIDIIDVLGSNGVIEILVNILQLTVSQINQPLTPSSPVVELWKVIESCLTCISVVLNYISISESITSLSFIVEFLVNMTTGINPELSSLSIVRNNVIGKLSVYLNHEPLLLSALMNILYTGLGRPSVASSSAFALMLLFQRCEVSHSLLQLESFYNQICELRHSGLLLVPSDLDILEGLSSIISRMNHDNSKYALEFILQPIINSLLNNVEKQASAKVLMDDIERITIILSKTSFKDKNYHEKPEITNPVVHVFIVIFPYLCQILQTYTSESIAEKICRCFKHFLNNVLICSLPLLDSLLSYVIQQYHSHSYSCFLYVCSISVKIFGESLQFIENTRLKSSSSSLSLSSNRVINQNNTFQILIDQDDLVLYQDLTVGRVKTTLSTMLQQVITIFFSRHNSLELFEQSPDIVEEFYYLIARVLQIAPLLFLNDSNAQTIVQAAIVGLNINHREAQKGILLFIQRLVELPYSLRNISPTPSIEMIRERTQNVLLEIMSPLVNQLLLNLSGQIPSYALDENYGSISDVLWQLKHFSSNHFQVCLIDGLQKLPISVQEIAQSISFQKSLVEAPHHRSFSKYLITFENQCRRVLCSQN